MFDDKPNLINIYTEMIGSPINESILINEVSEDVVDYLNKNKEDLPFSKMFGDKLRLVVPIGGDITAKEILDDLKTLKDYSGVDVGTGEVIRKIKLDPKYGQGSEKEQKMSIGKAVNSLKIDPEKKKKYLDWLAKYKDNLDTALSDISDYVIILSRAPIDIVRMSDHRNISSCHSSGGGYFQCAVQEAITGGAVAYVVDLDILDNHLNDSVDELQDDDFFHDPDRGIQSIRPISRLRVRRIESDDGAELGIPDDRVYGDSTIPGFKKYLNEFLKKYQKEEIQDYIENSRSWTARGGSYYDTNITKLADEFTSVGRDNNIRHSYDDEAAESYWATRGWEDELSSIKEEYNQSMDYCDVDYNIEDDDEQAYIYPMGGCTIDISSFNLPEDAHLLIDDFYDVDKAKNGHLDDDYFWSYVISYLTDKSDLGFGRVEIDNKHIELSFYNEHASVLYDPSAFRSEFCRDIKDFDDEILDMLEDEDELFTVFKEAGLILDVKEPELSRFSDYIQNGGNYQSFNLIGKQKNTFRLEYPEGFIYIQPKGELPRPPQVIPKLRSLANDFQNFIAQLGEELFKPTINIDPPNQGTFTNFFESYENMMSDIQFYIEPFNLEMTHFAQSTAQYSIFNSNISLKPNSIDDIMFQFFDFLDEMAPHIKNGLKMLILKNLKLADPESFKYYEHHNLPQLEMVYGKYLN